MALLKRKALGTIDEVRQEVLHLVERQKPGSPGDVTPHRPELDALLGSLTEFLPEWRQTPCVFRIARLLTDRELPPTLPWHHRAGIVTVSDNVVLPDLKHELPLVVQMLNYVREQRGLEPIRMPLFLQPDEIIDAARVRPPSFDHAEGEVIGWSRSLDELKREAEAVPGAPRKRLSREQLRRAVHDRDGWQCRECGTTVDLQLHPVEGDHAMDAPEGYLTLCRRCRQVAEGGGLKVAKTSARGFDFEDDEYFRNVTIQSQLALFFQKSALRHVGLVFGRNYVVLDN
jgi:hypothetical protein